MIDTSKIKGTRFMFGIALFLQGSGLLAAFISGVALQDSWLTIIFGSIISIPVIFMFKSIMLTFPDKNLIQVLRIVFGKVLGTIIASTYLFFFVTISALNLTDIGDFAKITVMRSTPKVVLLIICLFVAVYAIRKGLKVVMRYTTLFTFFKFALLTLSIVLVLNIVKLDNFLPILDLQPIKYIQSTHIITTIPIGEIVVFLMITPNVQIEKNKLLKWWFGGFLMGMITVFLIVCRDIAVLGSALNMFTLPGLISLRLVNIGPSLSRMEILFAIVLLILQFFKVSLLCYFTTVAIAQFFGMKKYKNLTILVCLLILLYALIIYPDPVSHAQNARRVTPIIGSFFEFLIPFLLIIVAKIRGFPKQPQKQALQTNFQSDEQKKQQGSNQNTTSQPAIAKGEQT
jgi:spore germination protein KB